jgi:acyl-coenzyme A thioesterase PaaI-like protein
MASREHANQVAKAHNAARDEDGPWGPKRALAAALRELLKHLPRTAAADAEVEALVPFVRNAVGRFAEAGTLTSSEIPSALYSGMEHFMDVGPIVGLSNAIAPPLEFQLDTEAGVVRGGGRFGAAYEGAPGLLHGGFLAAAIDELLGVATVLSGGPGMTRELTVRYLRPTPVDAELCFTARLDRVEGRKLFVSADVEADGVKTAKASGVFTAVGDHHFEAFAKARKTRDGS